jgi:hypothetical protein
MNNHFLNTFELTQIHKQRSELTQIHEFCRSIAATATQNLSFIIPFDRLTAQVAAFTPDPDNQATRSPFV